MDYLLQIQLKKSIKSRYSLPCTTWYTNPTLVFAKISKTETKGKQANCVIVTNSIPKKPKKSKAANQSYVLAKKICKT